VAARTKRPEHPGWGIVLVRLAVGLALVLAGWSKIASGVGPWLIESTADRIAASPALYAWWGSEVLLRWPDFFAHVLAWGSFVLGVAFFLGVLVRPAGWLIALLMLNVCLAGPPSYRELALLMAVCAIACAISRAGHRIGLDELLEPRLPGWVTWVRG